MKNLTTVFIMILVFCFGSILAQSDSEVNEDLNQRLTELESNMKSMEDGNSSFLMTGFTNLTYHQDLSDYKSSKFDHAGFSPILLWKPSDRLFFESELHIEMEGGVHGGEVAGGHNDGHSHAGSDGTINHAGSTHIDLGYANMVYKVSSGLIFNAGKFLTPIGIFNERYHPSWINTLPVDPIGMGHGGPLPAAELGAQIRGGIYLGETKFTYALYFSNGPILEEGTNDNESAGKLIYSNFSDNNGNKAVGGRISYFPFTNSSLEIGISGQHAGKTGDRGTRFENVNADILSFDLSYVKNLGSAGLLRFSGQYASIKVGDVDYQNSLEDIAAGAPILYTFDNESIFYYGTVSLRPIQHSKKFVNNSEFSIRYESGKTPEDSYWHADEQRILIGYTYWLHSRSAFKIASSFGDSNVMYAQLAIGL